ncbi:hypothetical protein Tco_0413148 [Tanacetum coccineum]
MMTLQQDKAIGLSNPFYLNKAQRIKPTLYDGSVIFSQHASSLMFDDEETLILKEVSRSKMPTKQNDPILKEKKVNTTPINYVELNRLSKDYGKHFVPHQELFNEQSFSLQTSHPKTDQSASTPVKIVAPRELPKVFVITSLKNDLRKLKGKETVENAAQIPIATTMAPGMFKIDLEPLAPRLLNNREAHIDYNLGMRSVSPETLKRLIEEEDE